MADFFYTIIIYPLYTLIECIFIFFKKVTPNLGFAVIGVSLGITLLCLPLYAVAEKWQEIERNKEKSMKRQLERIKSTFTGDERYMMTTAFYKECSYSPIMALRSSFGLLIQIPFFLAAYNFLSNLPSLQNSSFFFIKNMGAPDALFSIGSFTVNILPVLMTAINIAAGAVYTKGFPIKEKIQIYGMALIFLVILYNSPAGLVLYWTMNNVFSLIKNIFYKLKNPLKTFWICCCTLLVPATVYIFLYADTKLPNKIFFAIFSLLVFLLPVCGRAAGTYMRPVLSFLEAHKKRRFFLFFISCLALFTLTGAGISSNLIASSPVEFIDIGSHANPLYFIANTTVQSAGVFLFWTLCIYFLFNEGIQSILAILMCFLSYAALLNAYIFILPYGDFSTALVFLSQANFKTFAPVSFINLAAILLLAALLPHLILIKKGAVIRSVSSILVLAISGLSAVNIFTIQKKYIDYKTTFTKTSLTKVEPIYRLSANHENVILLMLDRGQTQYIPEMIKEAPELADIFSGFTYYNNVLSFNGHTLQGSPGLYGGYEYTPAGMNSRPQVPMVTKHNEALLLLPRIFTETKGFTADISDPSWANYQHYTDLSIIKNYPAIRGHQVMGAYNSLWSRAQGGTEIPDDTEKILKRNLLFFSFFRSAPICFRKLIYKEGYYWNSDNTSDSARLVIDSYAPLYFLQDLCKISDTDSGSFVYMSNELTHEDMFMQAPQYEPVRQVTDFGTSAFRKDPQYHTAMATFKLLGRWFTYLKEQGIYDNTRIILVSDHGSKATESVFEKDDELDHKIHGYKYYGRGHYHCLLMFKDFNASEPLRRDDTFMTNADVPSLLLKGLVDNPVNPFTQKTIPLDTTPLKAGGVYISASDAHQPEYNTKYTYSIKDSEWWHVQDDIFKRENWSQKVPELPKE